MLLSPSMKSGYQYFKINVDLEYMNEIYSIKAEPYNTLLELKENVLKKIFPIPKNIHCFYQNIDLYEKEDEQISMLFPLRKKIKIKLRKASREKKLVHSYKNIQSKPNLILDKKIFDKKIIDKTTLYKKTLTNNKNIFLSDSTSRLKKTLHINNNNIYNNNARNNNKIIKQKLLAFSSIDNNKNKQIKKSNDIMNSIGDDYFKNDELFYYLHKNKIMEYKLLSDQNKNNNNNLINEKNEKNETNSIFNTERRTRKKLKKIDRLSLNIKENKDIDNNNNDNNDYENNMKTIDKSKTNRDKEEIKVRKLVLKDNSENEDNENNDDNNDNNDNNDNKSEKSIGINTDNNLDNSQEEKNDNIVNKDNEENNNNVNDNNKNNEDNENEAINDINYTCSICKKNFITDYCLNCNQFICKNCVEKCNLEKHNTMKIKVDDDCYTNIMSYSQLIKSNIEKKVNDIKEYDIELKIYDIKKKKESLVLILNEITNLYSVITKILKNIYQEKGVNIAMEKYKTDTDKIKEEINEIVKKADSYIKSDQNNNTPKFKIMNLKYFFNLINEKNNNHNLITEKMTIYSLNSNINTNIKNTFEETEILLKKISNQDHPFELKDNLKKEYDKLIKEHQNLSISKDKKKIYGRRKTINIDKIDLSKINIPNIELVKSTDKNNNLTSDENI